MHVFGDAELRGKRPIIGLCGAFTHQENHERHPFCTQRRERREQQRLPSAGVQPPEYADNQLASRSDAGANLACGGIVVGGFDGGDAVGDNFDPLRARATALSRHHVAPNQHKVS